ncbi:tyrosine-type recombinase/integrase [Bermanella marisrubri]|uniref:Integrase n=1 Tax=Bermanella marisrubri TaxID=207949 RepID=Q1N4R2_9GAMM|nr:tyrosine-type recombinase/integrase [Bermanella marisrubri]EAT13366.1 Integrase [Oceanobacter sp. RED65] [Bermanella marisrubri]QIZ84121.1 tyrosine-type recombinase/integrase [Bermanella marisrubri]
MPVKKTKQGNYRAQFQADGTRYDKTFPTAKEAKHWEAETKAAANKGLNEIFKNAKTPMVEMVHKWYDLHGNTLRDGLHQRNALVKMCEAMGNPQAGKFKPETFLNYRRERLSAGISENMVNHELTYLKSMFNWLTRFFEWNQENPLKHVKKVTQYDVELRYLEHDEIKTLIAALESGRSSNPSLITRLCLSTGMRWNEANQLRRENLIPSQNKIRLNITKNSKARTLLITPQLMNEIVEQGEPFGRLFPQDHYNAFKLALDKTEIKLPKGQRTHVLRHTFASWYMINGGRLEVLQKILGHGTILMTMKYAHLAPDYLDTMTTLNPLDHAKP